MARWVLRGFT
jgi:hypothetical protein